MLRRSARRQAVTVYCKMLCETTVYDHYTVSSPTGGSRCSIRVCFCLEGQVTWPVGGRERERESGYTHVTMHSDVNAFRMAFVY